MRRDFVHIAIVSVLAAILGLRLHRVITIALFESQVRNVLQQQAERLPGTHVETVSFQQGKGIDLIRAVVRGPDAPTAEQVATMQSSLPRSPNGGAVELRVRFVRVVIMTRRGPLPSAGIDAAE